MASDQVFEDDGGNTNQECECGVTEVIFPCLGKCCVNSSLLSSRDVYKKNCPHCSIWTSLPDGASLVITHIFECSLHGYDKRMKF